MIDDVPITANRRPITTDRYIVFLLLEIEIGINECAIL